MILGVGIDLVSIARVTAVLERHGDRALRRLFAPGEVGYCRSRGRPDASFAARFAAKEAFFKALGTGVSRGMAWAEVEVVSGADGAPSLRLTGVTAAEARTRGVRHMHLSLTHTDEMAGAYVILEG
jgi:holo-[acyl-carrier protein] synthase